MTSLPLDELYLEWLYSQVADVEFRSRRKTYWAIFRKLYTTEFVWIVPNDDNRVEDGRDLRYEFLHDREIDLPDRDWMELGCSFLEMLIGLSRRLAFETEGESRDWFWHLMKTIDLAGYNDGVELHEERVDDILSTIIWRSYRPDGDGGLFPLRDAHYDQRKTEIWSQMNAYLLENY